METFSKKVAENEFILLLEKDYLNEAALCFLNEKTREFIKEKLALQKDATIFYTIENFDDEEPDSYDAVAILVNKKSLIKKLGIFSLDNLKKYSIGEVKTIENNGMVRFSIAEKGFPKEKVENFIFSSIKDVYHSHIYAHHADRLLEPVYAENKKEAIELIVKKFETKIINYHKRIKSEFDGTRRIKRFSYRRLKNLKEDIMDAKGEMIHALSYIELFDVSIKKKESIKIALKSFDNLDSLHSFYSIERGTKTNVHVLVLTFLVTIATVHFLLNEFEFAKPLLCLSIAGAIGGLISLIILPLTNWYTTKN